MPAPAGLPFTVHQDQGTVTITIHRDAGQDPVLFTRPSVDWIRGLRCRVVLDFEHICQVNSALVAWLFQLVQTGRPSSVTLHRANATVIGQLEQFHLEHFIAIDRA
jgi:hypothetical protein